MLDAQATRVRRTDQSIELNIQSKNNSTTLVGSHLLVATGRVPNSDTLNLAAAGIRD